MAALNYPYYTVPGNHDIRGDSRSRLSRKITILITAVSALSLLTAHLFLTDAQLFRRGKSDRCSAALFSSCASTDPRK